MLRERHRSPEPGVEFNEYEVLAGLPILEHFGIDGFVGKTENSFEVTGHDRDGVPEYLGVWS